jgi:hypothetical protein
LEAALSCHDMPIIRTAVKAKRIIERLKQLAQ